MLKIKVANGTVAIITGVEAKDVEWAPAKLIDEKGNDIFAVGLNPGSDGKISDHVFVGNAVIDGKVACVRVLMPNETIEDIRNVLKPCFAHVSSCVEAIEADIDESKRAFDAAWAGAIEA